MSHATFIPSQSREFVTAKISAPAGVDLESLDVDMAIVPRNEVLTEEDWREASWAPGSSDTVRLLIGPGSAVGSLAPGAYTVWIRVDSGAEVPIRRSGVLVIKPTE